MPDDASKIRGSYSSVMIDQGPWYSEGLRFQCTGCGDCCTGEPGFVWVSEDEIAALADWFGESLERFERSFIRNVYRRKSLVEVDGGDCVLFDPRRRQCTAYPVRPAQCRSWPFWHMNLRTPEAWTRACEQCPGTGRGRLYSLPEIEKQRSLKKS